MRQITRTQVILLVTLYFILGILARSLMWRLKLHGLSGLADPELWILVVLIASVLWRGTSDVLEKIGTSQIYKSERSL